MAKLGMILDLSHLTEEAVTYALAHYPGPIIASHSNARALLPHNTPERHLSNRAIRQLAGRQGVIGLVLPHDFVKDRISLGSPRHLVTLDDVVDQIDYMAQLVGHCRHLGLGSDLDGGFGLEHSPEALDSIADLPRLANVLDRRGYSPADIEAIMGGNWLNFLSRALPETP
jgi:membrane dipeptidase